MDILASDIDGICLLFRTYQHRRTYGSYFRDIGLGATSAALAVSVSWIVSAIGNLVWGWITDRIPRALRLLWDVPLPGW
ncbi:MAG: hypothetical protein Ct9H300mP11_29250 [Chloroflexota bacterium]|nr:MAG: hypothetical protein Ct9H300mP11_29250 [Chloroflexota bacterium]